jgi:hypothetical protein
MSRAYDWAEDQISKLEKRIEKLEKDMKLKPPHKRHFKIPKKRRRAVSHTRPTCGGAAK